MYFFAGSLNPIDDSPGRNLQPWAGFLKVKFFISIMIQ